MRVCSIIVITLLLISVADSASAHRIPEIESKEDYAKQALSPESKGKSLTAKLNLKEFKAKYNKDVIVNSNGSVQRIAFSGIHLAPELTHKNIERVSTEFIHANPSLFKVSSNDLKFQSGGFYGKMWYVIFDRYYRGLPVYSSFLRLVYSSAGALVSVTNRLYPELSVNINPSVSESDAIGIALQSNNCFNGDYELQSVELLIYPLENEISSQAHLAWKVAYLTSDPIGRWYIFVDAQTGEIIQKWNSINYGFYGAVRGSVHLIDPHNQPENKVFKDLTVTALNHGSDETDQYGYYFVPGDGSDWINAGLSGPYVKVNNLYSGNAWFSEISSGYLNIFWDPYSTESERDAYYHTIQSRDFIKALDPQFIDLDWQLDCNINFDGDCQSYWDGGSINFARAGDLCMDMAQMPTIVMHEYGHAITELLYLPEELPNYDEPGGLSEAWADIFANSITDQPLIGRGIYGIGTYMRTSDNDDQYEGNDCSGDPHCMGRIMSGALWHMKENLRAEYGDDINPYADSLWHFPRYAKPMDFASYLWEILLFDDDDSNPINGTPHYHLICEAFARHTIDCPEIHSGVEIEHEPLPNTESNDPYPVIAGITSAESEIDTAYVYWSNGGNSSIVHMDHIGNDQYTANIPGQSSGTMINYYIYATDELHNYAQHPEIGYHSFFVGQYDTVYTDSMEYGGDDWVHYPVTSDYIDQWDIRDHRNHSPNGSKAWKCGSPLSYGDYANNIDAGLITPYIFIPAGAFMSFWMWGEIEESSSDRAWDGAMVEISVQGEPFVQLTPEGSYTHTTIGDYNHPWPADTPCWSGNFDWTRVVLDLTDYGEMNGYIRFRMGTDEMETYEGWYIDDVNLWGYGLNYSRPWQLTLTPHDAPIIVPVGGDFSYDISVVNNTGEGGIRDAWINLLLPSGSKVTIAAFNNRYFDPGENIFPDLTQYIPIIAPPGDYTYIGCIGDRPSIIFDSSYFYFEVVSGIDGGYEGKDWLLVGWEREESRRLLPDRTELIGNMPNPFNPVTTIKYNLAEESDVSLEIYNLLGRKVISLVDEHQQAGYKSVRWDASQYASGIYFYRMRVGNKVFTKRMLLLK